MTDFAALTTTDVSESSIEVAIVPTGSTEQHGPALPLGTDTYAADHFADIGATVDGVIRTPPVPVGVSSHHRHFDGSLWVDEDTFVTYVEQIARSLASHDLNRIVFVNGHGGNVNALKRVGQRLRGEGIAYAICWNWWDAVSDQLEAHFEGQGGHAGQGETSMMLAIDSGLVHRDRLAAAGAGAPLHWGESRHGADVGLDTIDFTPTGAVGDPEAASQAIGDELEAAATEELHALLDWLRDVPSEELFEHTRPVHPPD